MAARVFLLSPARSDGKRASMLMRADAGFELARRLRDAEGATLGELYAFMSGLYFRGKLEYATRFAAPPAKRPGALVITPGRGLVDAGAVMTLADLEAIAAVAVDKDDPRFREPLLHDARALARTLGRSGEAVLLGSIATDKYVQPLQEALGSRLHFPEAFVGRGDMSRGGLLLRSARSGVELDYRPLSGAERRGPRPPRLSESALPARGAGKS